jgi:uncharacterized protein (TIGR02246 family)
MSEIEGAVDRFRDAWNRHDADALATLWTEDGELNHPWGLHATGQDAIRTLLGQEHSSTMAGSRLRIVKVVSSVDHERATAEIDGVLEGVIAPNGRTYDLNHRIFAMFVADGDGWRIRSMTPLANPRT